MKKKVETARRRWALVMMAVLGLLAASFSPAGAVSVPPESGAGTSTGQTTTLTEGDPEDLPVVGDHPLCLPITKAVFEFDHTGTYTATQLTDPQTGDAAPKRALFTGTAEVRVETQALYYLSPAGTFQDSLCMVPALVPVTASVSSAAGNPGSLEPNPAGESVDCPSPSTGAQATGYYNRTGEAAVIEFHAKCTVTGVLVGIDSAVPPDPALPTEVGTVTTELGDPTHTIEATQQPCLPIPPPGSCQTVGDPENGAGVYTEFVGTYTET